MITQSKLFLNLHCFDILLYSDHLIMSVFDIGFFMKIRVLLDTFGPMIILTGPIDAINTMFPSFLGLEIIANVLNKILPELGHTLTAFRLRIIM